MNITRPGIIKKLPISFLILSLLGGASILLYSFAFLLKDLRVETVAFEWVFFSLFGLYLLAGWYVLQEKVTTDRRPSGLVLIFGFAILFRAILVFTQPTLTDDMYRYIWDGRVQAHQISPYLYPPSAPEVAALRDSEIWPWINRKGVVTVYPAGAQLAFAAAWRIWPDNVHWFQAVMTFGDLIAAVILCYLLRAVGRSPQLVLIYLWNPLLTFEIAHAAHVDGLVLPFLVAAWLARQKGRDTLTGLLLGLAASLKLYPVLLLPALWRLRDERGRFRPAWRMPLAFMAGFLTPYLPYLSTGKAVLGFLPQYFHEQFNFLLTGPLYYWVNQAGGQPDLVINLLIVAVLLTIYLFFFFRPAANAETALRRCIWPIGAYTLLTQNLYPWYLLWLVPLLPLFLPARRLEERLADLAMRLLRTSWTGWWLFTGLIALAYTFYIHWWPDFVAIVAQFILLYEFLLIDLGRWLKQKISLRGEVRSEG